MEQVVEGEDEGGAEEDEESDAPAGLAVDFGEEVGARDVEGDAAGNGYAVEKGVDEEAEKNAAGGAVKVHGFGMDFFAEMEMRGQSVLEEMHEEESGKDEEKCGVAAEADGFGDDVNKGDGEHVAGAESDEVLQKLARPFAADDEIAAEEITGSGDEAEGGGGGDAD